MKRPADSDLDALTFLAAVTLGESFPDSDPHTDAPFRPLTAAAAAYVTRFQEAVSGNVLDNDPPPAGNPLAVARFINFRMTMC